jgi:hypothetical protein
MRNGRYFWCGCASCSLVAIVVCAISVSVYYTSQDRIYFKTPASTSSSSSGYEQKYFSASATSQEDIYKQGDQQLYPPPSRSQVNNGPLGQANNNAQLSRKFPDAASSLLDKEGTFGDNYDLKKGEHLYLSKRLERKF